MAARYLDTAAGPAAAAASAAPAYRVITPVNVRARPTTDAPRRRTLPTGETVTALERRAGWIRIGEAQWVVAWALVAIAP